MVKEVRRAFEGDLDIFKYFDPSASVKTIDDVVDNVVDKLFDYATEYDVSFVPFDNGYIFHSSNMLISFGINVEHRTSENLSAMWDFILERLGDNFTCMLFDRNTRAINWLKRCGMRIEKDFFYEGHKIIVLCH
jgi:hypothetical protein